MSKSLEYVDDQVVIDLTRRLIKSQSPSGNEKKLATLMAIEMKKAGFNLVQYDEHNNIVGIMPGIGKGKTLVLVGHIDTVPPGEMSGAFDPREVDGSKFGIKGKVITGRGSCDMKGALAAMICAGSALKRARARLKGNFAVIGLASTKNGNSTGLKKLLEKFEIDPHYIVSCAPTNLEINIAHPGQATYELIANGKMTNIGNPKQGESAILKMNRIIDCLQQNVVLPEDKRFGKANMIISSVSSIPTGESHSIPNKCNALLVRQFFKGENPEVIKNNFIEILKKNNFKDEDVAILLKRAYNPLDINPKSEIISLIEAAKQLAIGKGIKLSQWISGVNISELFDVNIPVVGFGPGDEKLAHTSIEHIPVDQVIKATKVYTVLVEKICVQMKEKSS